MTDYFIDSTLASGAQDGTSWEDAYRAGTQVDWASATSSASTLGDRIIVASDNDTTAGADVVIAANANHTIADPLQIIVSASGSGTTVAPESNHGTAGNGEIDGGGFDIAYSGNVYVHGLRAFNYDNSPIDATGKSPQFEKCFIGLNKTSSAEGFPYSSGGEVTYIDCDIDMATQNHRIDMTNDGCKFKMVGGSITTDANIVRIFNVGSTKSADIYMEGVDLTAINSATDLIQSGGVLESLNVKLINCKLPATMFTLFGSTITNLERLAYVIITGDQGEVYAQYGNGNLLPETTILRDGGADSGSNPFSIKFESSSLASRTNPMRHVFAISNPGDLDTLTIKCHFAQDSGSALDNDQIWIECRTQTSSDVSSDTDRMLLGGSPIEHTNESGNVDWLDGVGALDTPATFLEQSCSVTVSGVTTGLLYVTLCVADDFSTDNLYVDPKVVIA